MGLGLSSQVGSQTGARAQEGRLNFGSGEIMVGLVMACGKSLGPQKNLSATKEDLVAISLIQLQRLRRLVQPQNSVAICT